MAAPEGRRTRPRTGTCHGVTSTRSQPFQRTRAAQPRWPETGSAVMGRRCTGRRKPGREQQGHDEPGRDQVPPTAPRDGGWPGRFGCHDPGPRGAADRQQREGRAGLCVPLPVTAAELVHDPGERPRVREAEGCGRWWGPGARPGRARIPRARGQAVAATASWVPLTGSRGATATKGQGRQNRRVGPWPSMGGLPGSFGRVQRPS